MKIAAQADYLIQSFGAEAALSRLKSTGYNEISYQINGRYNEPFTKTWTDADLKQHFQPIRNAAEKLQMHIPFTVLGTAIYNDLMPESTSDRIKMTIQAIKATYYMGSKVLAIRPVFFYLKNDYKLSKQLTYNLFETIKKEADLYDIQLAFINNANCYAYGSCSLDLIELADAFHARILIDPSIAFYAGARVDELLSTCGDRIIGFLVTDTKNRIEEPSIPTQGSLNYESIIIELEKCNQNAYITMMYSSVLKRYIDFIDCEGVVDAVDQFLYKMGNVLIGKEEKL